jgi:hypothetical protein
MLTGGRALFRSSDLRGSHVIPEVLPKAFATIPGYAAGESEAFGSMYLNGTRVSSK